MMNKNQPQLVEQVEECFAKRVVSLLNGQSQHLSGDVQERLRETRMLAVSRAKPEPSFVAELQTTNRSLRNSSWNSPVWSFTGWLIPIIIVTLGLIAISEWQQDQRIKDIANVDIALLTDDVPPDAFVDNGFMAYLKLKTSSKAQEASKAEDEKI